MTTVSESRLRHCDLFLTAMRLWALFVLSIAFGAGCQRQGEPDLIGKVVEVTDGDTFTVLVEGEKSVEVRLYGIDAPEVGQALDARAKQELSDLVLGKDVEVYVVEKDRDGRSVSKVSAGIPVNLAMVRRGFAWWDRAHAKEDLSIAHMETEARDARRGVWSDPAPVAPWEFRQNASQAKETATR